MADETNGMRVTPYLTVKGAAEAIALYEKVFGAKECMRMPGPDGKRLMHAALSINGGTLMLSDEFLDFAECSPVAAPSVEKPAPVAVALTLDRAADVDETFKRAVDAGCIGVMAPHDAFWGDRFAVLGDPFGHRWLLTATLPQK